MRKLSTVLLLILTILWGYTSWYWYTCKIKWFCSLQRLEQEAAKSDVLEIPLWNQGVAGEQEDSTLTTEIQEISKQEWINVETSEIPSQLLEKETEENPPEEGEIIVEKEVVNLTCSDILSKAISLWGAGNDEEEVKKLEQFLNKKEWEQLDIDGRYSQDDFDAVKRFQLKYRKEILDPWKISYPTWYVYTTTIKKINEIHCDK